MDDNKSEPWRIKLRDNLIDKGSWALIAFALAAGWNWYQRLPSNNLNIRSVAVKIPNPTSEQAIAVCIVTEKGKQEINQFVSNNTSLPQIDLDILKRVTDTLVISDLDAVTQQEFAKIQDKACKRTLSNIKDPPWLEIVAILSTDATYLLDRDCTLSIINDPNSTGIAKEFWNQKPTVELKEVAANQVPYKIIWNYRPLPIPKRLALLHSGLPVRAIVNKTSDESFLVSETKSYDFEVSFDQEARRKFFEDHIIKYLKKGNRLPISITCTIQSVGREPFQVTSEPFFAEVGYRDSKIE